MNSNNFDQIENLAIIQLSYTDIDEVESDGAGFTPIGLVDMMLAISLNENA